MSISLQVLENRKNELQICLKRSEDLHQDLKERIKDLKKEVANTKGAILEIDHLMDDLQ